MNPNTVYLKARSKAKERGIPWEFTFDSWWAMWEPHIDRRGQSSDDLCMCRYGDSGPYSPDNCRIDTQANNTKEARWFGMMGNNTSGITGVRWMGRMWSAYIQVDGNRIQRKFKTLLDAAAFRLSAENRLREGEQDE